MSTIHMLTKQIQFNGFVNTPKAINKMITQDGLSFPSNIIGCGLSLVQTNFSYLGTTSTPPAAVYGNVMSIGIGIDNICYNGTVVTFTAWMQLLASDGTDWIAALNPNTSYLTVQAIAECE